MVGFLVGVIFLETAIIIGILINRLSLQGKSLQDLKTSIKSLINWVWIRVWVIWLFLTIIFLLLAASEFNSDKFSNGIGSLGVAAGFFSIFLFYIDLGNRIKKEDERNEELKDIKRMVKKWDDMLED